MRLLSAKVPLGRSSGDFLLGRALLLALMLALLPAIGLAGDKPPMAQHLGVPEHLTPDTRAALAARMGRHAEVMSNLVRAVILLDRPTVQTLASRIADEEVIAQTNNPPPEPGSLTLPRQFFGAQTELATAARALAVAAGDRGDDQVLAQRFAALTTTCVSCHSFYLHGRPDLRPVGPK